MKKGLALMFGLPALLAADIFDEGAKIFRTSCAVGYCHGSGGSQGRAPKLVARNFDRDMVMKVTRDGIPNTGMPGWSGRLSAAELEAVVAYVVKISGGNTAGLATAGASGQAIPPEVKRGRELFVDPLRGVNRCNTCHGLEGMGTAVGPNLAVGGPYDPTAIRNGRTGVARAASLRSGERFAALVVEQGEWVKIYDLGVVPPVLRTLSKGEVNFSGEASWRHSSAVQNYSDAELGAVAAYLRWTSSQ